MEPVNDCVQHISVYVPLSEDDTAIYEKYKKSIDQKIRETFPSIPSNFDLKPVTVFRLQGCGTFFHYKVALPDSKYAKVSFHTGGLPMDFPSPNSKNYEPEEPNFDIDSVLTSTADE